MLGRCRRDIVVFDSGRPRNAASGGLHGFLTRDGTPPMELRAMARREVARYPTVQFCDRKVITVARDASPATRFRVRTEDGATFDARTLLLATGRDDVLPDRPGFVELYGRGVYHCPFCDGWENRDEPFVAFGRGDETCAIALELLTWSRQVTLCSDGPCGLDDGQRHHLAENRIEIVETEVARLEAGPDGRLAAIRLVSGEVRACRALFFVSDCPQKSALPENLGCELDASGGVACTGHAATGVPGLFVAGNVRGGLHFAITAAAEGAEAAVAINDALLEIELRGS